MKIVTFSDTHSLHHMMPEIPDGDVLIFAGDMCGQSNFVNVKGFYDFIKKQPHKHKIVIAGNHDWPFDNELHSACTELFWKSNIHYLQDSDVTIDGVNFYGSPQTPEFMAWAFNVARGNTIKKYWDMIPSETDVLITHGPPHGILDVSSYGNEHCGCEELRIQIFDRIKPKVHIFGHIHEGYGTHKENGIRFINASTCTEYYRPTNEPIVTEI